MVPVKLPYRQWLLFDVLMTLGIFKAIDFYYASTSWFLTKFSDISIIVDTLSFNHFEFSVPSRQTIIFIKTIEIAQFSNGKSIFFTCYFSFCCWQPARNMFQIFCHPIYYLLDYQDNWMPLFYFHSTYTKLLVCLFDTSVLRLLFSHLHATSHSFNTLCNDVRNQHFCSLPVPFFSSDKARNSFFVEYEYFSSLHILLFILRKFLI